MDQECLDNHIIAIQYLQADLAEDMNRALSCGRSDVACLVKNNSQITAYLRVLDCQNPDNDSNCLNDCQINDIITSSYDILKSYM